MSSSSSSNSEEQLLCEPRISYNSLDTEMDKINEGECVICLEDMPPNTHYVFDCGHKLHHDCFHKYFSYHYDMEMNHISCPVCRRPLEVRIEPVPIDNSIRLKKLLLSSGMFAILLFSSFCVYSNISVSQ